MGVTIKTRARIKCQRWCCAFNGPETSYIEKSFELLKKERDLLLLSLEHRKTAFAFSIHIPNTEALFWKWKLLTSCCPIQSLCRARKQDRHRCSFRKNTSSSTFLETQMNSQVLLRSLNFERILRTCQKYHKARLIKTISLVKVSL